MKLAKILVFGLILAFFTIGCKKNDILNKDGSSVVQGNITLKVHSFHHSWGVPYVHLYLKRMLQSFQAVIQQFMNIRFRLIAMGMLNLHNYIRGIIISMLLVTITILEHGYVVNLQYN